MGSSTYVFRHVESENELVKVIVLIEENGIVKSAEPCRIEKVTSRISLVEYPKNVVEMSLALIRIRIENGVHKCCIEFRRSFPPATVLRRCTEIIEWLLKNEHLCEMMLASMARYLMSYGYVRMLVKETCGEIPYSVW